MERGTFMRTAPSSFNKEQAVFLCAAIACAGMAYRFFASQPILLVSGAPISGGRAEPLSPQAHEPSVKEESAYFHGTRKSPFYLVKVIPPPPPKKDEDGPVKPPIDVPAAGIEKPEFQVRPPEELYAFSGVIVWNGQAHALLVGKTNSTTLRAREGDKIAGGFRITRIEKQSIELKHESGQVFVLKDKGV
jgi:hypothetical protein